MQSQTRTKNESNLHWTSYIWLYVCIVVNTINMLLHICTAKVAVWSMNHYCMFAFVRVTSAAAWMSISHKGKCQPQYNIEQSQTTKHSAVLHEPEHTDIQKGSILHKCPHQDKSKSKHFKCVVFCLRNYLNTRIKFLSHCCYIFAKSQQQKFQV